jgi:hypothetical protein
MESEQPPMDQKQSLDTEQSPNAESDLSKRTLIILVALSCVISVVGTIAMVYELTSVSHPAPTTLSNSEASAKVGFTIGPPTAQPSTRSSTTGLATFKIEKQDRG